MITNGNLLSQAPSQPTIYPHDIPETIMTYEQWVVIVIRNTGHRSCKIKNIHAARGKLHADNDKDKEVRHSYYEGKLVGPFNTMQINACGIAHTHEGTSGSFDLVDAENGHVVRHFFWKCPDEPWLKNTWEVTGSHEEWKVKHKGAKLDGPALETITVEVQRRGPW